MNEIPVRQKRKYVMTKPRPAGVVTKVVNARVQPELRRQLERRGNMSAAMRTASIRHFRLIELTKPQLRVMLKDPKEQRLLIKAYRNGGEEGLLASAVRFTDVQKYALLDCVERWCMADETDVSNLLK